MKTCQLIFFIFSITLIASNCSTNEFKSYDSDVNYINVQNQEKEQLNQQLKADWELYDLYRTGKGGVKDSALAEQYYRSFSDAIIKRYNLAPNFHTIEDPDWEKWFAKLKVIVD